MKMEMSSAGLRASLSRITKNYMVVFLNSLSASSLWSAWYSLIRQLASSPKYMNQALQQAFSSDFYVQTLIHNFNSVLSFSWRTPPLLLITWELCLSKEAINLDFQGKIVMHISALISSGNLSCSSWTVGWFSTISCLRKANVFVIMFADVYPGMGYDWPEQIIDNC